MTVDPDLARATYDVHARRAADFDQTRDKSLFDRAWLDRFLVHVPPGGHILDLGCGSGAPIAAYLLECGYRVSGIDASPAMITLATSRYPEARWHVGDMRTLDLENTFDGVLGWNSFFNLTRTEQRATLPRMIAHAKPGAPLMVTTGTSDGEVTGIVAGEAVYHASLAPEAYRAILDENDCDIMDFVPEDLNCRGHTVLLARKHPAD